MRTTAKYEVDALVKDLIEQFSGARLPMPVVVLYAEDDDPGLDREVESVVRAVQEAQESGGLPHQLVECPDGGDPHRNAVGILDGLAKGPWARRGPAWYRAYACPRSRLVAAIEAAARHVLGPGEVGAADQAARPLDALVDDVLVRLRDLHWRPEPRTAGGEFQRLLSPVLNSTTLIGAFVLAGVTSLLTQAHWQVVVLVMLAALLVLGTTGWIRRNTAPLSWLGQASRWFATTTFLAASGRQAAAWSLWRPRMSWDVTQARAREVAGEILKAQLPGTPAEDRDRAQQFHLQLRTLALLEDLRWAHRSWAPDLRGRKRRVPPVVFVPRAGADNGALRVLGAISDVRSRRSEQDPLLVLAGVAHADVAGWLEDAGTAPVTVHAVGSRRRGPYENWVSDLRVRQAPSRGRALAWTLPVRLTRLQLGAGETTRLVAVPVRRSWWVLWSRWTVLAVLVLGACGGVLRAQQLSDLYCRPRLVGSDPDAVWRQDPGGTRECIGVATDGISFAGDGGGIRLSGELPGGDAKRTGAAIGLESLEQSIRDENARVAALPDVRYVTIVYAGSLTTTAGQQSRALNSLKELTGVHLAQLRNNAGDPLKIKILVANGGQDMYFQTDMVRRIVALAQRDRSVVGVVGLGRDTADSGPALDLLQQAGLAVVSTTNSGTYLARGHVNYFGLAATDQEEAAALRLVVDGLHLQPAQKFAAVLTRRPSQDDRYSPEQAEYGSAMLKDAGFQLIGGRPLEYGLTSNGDPDFEAALSTSCHSDHAPAVLYLAGRADDVNQLMRRLAADAGCSGPLTVLTGDDLTKAQFRTGATWMAPQATLYYTALTDPAATARASDLAEVAAADLRIAPGGDNPYEDDVFSDGALAIAYDATAALQAGAAKAGASQKGGVGSVMAGLRAVEMKNRATGTVDFRDTRPLATGPQPGHGLHIIRVRRAAEGMPLIDLICGRPAGDVRPLTGCAP
ncbi:ABC transporter substrate-binding protein [Kitasatospora paranensis]|uniref:ABC transporter substrate-binding protein n=1 Tax=Kitasatospora paranensis TaxID=258053 RepID=A0ABW2FTL8_9ACTN